MNDIEREAAQLLACYVREERPPPEIDLMVRARLRAEARRRTTWKWIGVWGVAAAVVLLLWALASAGSLLRAEEDASSAALHAVQLTDVRGLVVQPGERRPMRTVQAAPPPEAAFKDDDPGVEALHEARGLMRAGDFKAAFERLEPCRQTVGTDDLLEECEFIALQALCRTGEVIEGRLRLTAFRSRWPSSSHVKLLSKFCPG